MPSSASMSEMREELRDMKSEILELKQLMRTSFDLQLEIQRAIRQEVAAALSSMCTPTSILSHPPISSGTKNLAHLKIKLPVNTCIRLNPCIPCSNGTEGRAVQQDC